MYSARPQVNDAGRRDIALVGLGSGAGASTGRDPRYGKGFQMGEQPVGFSRQGVLELMTADMPIVEELKRGLPKLKFLQARILRQHINRQWRERTAGWSFANN